MGVVAHERAGSKRPRGRGIEALSSIGCNSYSIHEPHEAFPLRFLKPGRALRGRNEGDEVV